MASKLALNEHFPEKMNFYQSTLEKCLKKGFFAITDTVLIVGGGQFDKDTFLNLGFTDVVISNVGAHNGYEDYKPYKWEYQDAEELTFADNSFDWIFTHAVLHHCASPHKAVCEMLRVARKGIGVFEARDSFLMRVSIKLGLVPRYEIEPSVFSNGKFGGYRNTCVPNFVYRWTENEVVKTVSSYLPHYNHNYHFFYGLRMPDQRMSHSVSFIKKLVNRAGSLVLPVFRLFFKKQCNNFAFIVSKKGQLQPWLKYQNEEYIFDMDYAKEKYLLPENKEA